MPVDDNLEGHLNDQLEATMKGLQGKRRISQQENSEWAESKLVKTRSEKRIVNYSDFELLMVIGRGTFGKVYLA